MKKRVLIGVSGGIAVYKALDIISALRKCDVEVKVIMTKSACEFVTPLSFQSLSQNMVVTDMFSEPKAWEIQHISLAQWADVILLAPATANIIGKLSNGIADDMLSTTVMASKANVIIAPAMNTQMYENKIVQNNILKLKEYGYKFIEPASGRLACGDIGRGKLAAVNDIVSEVISELKSLNIEENKEKDLINKKILITAGPTIAPIDPVRYITNKSTGKMGYAIAEEAKSRGAEVILISGPTNLEIPTGIEFIRVKTNSEMKEAVEKHYKDSDIVVKSAAVSDFKMKEYSKEKIKKVTDELNISLIKDNDILKALGENKENQILVGFAAESNNVIENARKKLSSKNLDYIVANDITSKNTGFASNENKVTILSKDGTEVSLDKMTKRSVAKNIFDVILEKR